MGLFRKKKYEVKTFDEGVEENKIIKKENHKLIRNIAIGLSFLMIIFLLAVLLSIYNSLITINKYVAYSVVALIIILFFIFIILPIIKALNQPTFIIDATTDKTNVTMKNYHTMKKVAKNLIEANNSIPFEHKEKLRQSLNDKYALKDNLKTAYHKYLAKDINKLILAHATKVACTTAVSKNDFIDASTTIISNVRLIMQIVIKCGYRPSYLRLSKLIIKVFRNAIVAYTISATNTGEQLTNIAKKLIKGVPIVGNVVGPMLEGAANGFLTTRIGITTKKYLLNEFKLQSNILNEEKESLIAQTSAIEAKQLIEGDLDEQGNDN